MFLNDMDHWLCLFYKEKLEGLGMYYFFEEL